MMATLFSKSIILVDRERLFQPELIPTPGILGQGIYIEGSRRFVNIADDRGKGL
jgi:hypothetical protein